jgi:hypothetical protein
MPHDKCFLVGESLGYFRQHVANGLLQKRSIGTASIAKRRHGAKVAFVYQETGAK